MLCLSHARSLALPSEKIDHVPSKEGKHCQGQSDGKVGPQPFELEFAFPILELQYIGAHKSLEYISEFYDGARSYTYCYEGGWQEEKSNRCYDPHRNSFLLCLLCYFMHLPRHALHLVCRALSLLPTLELENIVELHCTR
jgi:hypothetical protein